MKCTACGLPLSPARNASNCPRCGTSIASSQKPNAGPVHMESPAWSNNGGAPIHVGVSAQEQQWGQPDQFSAYQPPAMHTPYPQQPQPGQIWSSASNAPQRPPRFSLRNSRFGFLIAGLCVLTGGILLVLVFLLSMGQPGNNPTTNNNNNNSAPASTHAVSSPAVSATTGSTPSATTTTYPGQQYITNAQMTSALPTASQPVQPATTFKANQTIYVTFNINSGGQGGAICLIWYLNGKASFNYAFAVGAHTTSTYAQAVYGTPGSAYVELYWASSKSCTGQVLAQHVDFTVTA